MTAAPIDRPTTDAARTNTGESTASLTRQAASENAPADAAEAAWVVTWRRVRLARQTLQARTADAARIDSAFRREIEPRERRFTTAIIALVGTLIDRYQTGATDAASRSLLGLWINENLELLEDHPFADPDALQALSGRWRGALDRALDNGLNGADDPTARALSGLGRAQRVRGGASVERDGDERPEAHARRRRSAGDEPASTTGSQRSADALDVDALLLDAGEGRDKPDAVAALIARLFRRLAQALHPDREADAERRTLKQTLMGSALEARANADLDGLLQLHVEHVGDPLDGADAGALEHALRRQLETLNRALARLRGGDPLRRRIRERYGMGSNATDEAASNAAIARHAEALEGAIAGAQRQRVALLDPSGLDAALAERREREQDRLAIDELTGLG